MQNDHNPLDGDDDMPKLSIKQENEFKKMKMNLENGAVFPDEMMKDLPPEIEGAFLDTIMSFEKALKNAKRITVAQKLDNFHFIPENVLNDAEIDVEIEKVQEALQANGIRFVTIVKDEYSNREIYKFLTEDFMQVEIEDFQVKGMITCLNYEEYRPNHRYTLTEIANDFVQDAMDLNSKNFEEHSFANDAVKDQIDFFRTKFQKLHLVSFEIVNIDFNAQTANVFFQINFEALHHDGTNINFDGPGQLKFNFQDNYWHINQVEWPQDTNLSK